ncbi:hypothetical protein LSAT2_026885 [Lamellibrachia satsuma]|nr:hypothetical protein LSAT2_026885 [Lamellibrachia satsuma]
MGKVVIFLMCVLLTACRSLSAEVTSNWLESTTGPITPHSGINERGTVAVLETNATVLTDDNSTFSDGEKWTQLTTDANVNKRPLHSNVTANEDRDKAGVKMTIRYVSYVVLPILVITGICGNIVTIRVMLAKEFRSMFVSVFLIALALSDTVVIFVSIINKHLVRSLIGVDIRSFDVTGCRVYFWAYRTSKMMSSWIVVFICVERFIAVCFPLRTKNMCTKRIANTSIAVTLLICGACNAFRVWLDTSIVQGTCVSNSIYRTGSTTVVGCVLLLSISAYAPVPATIMVVLNSFTVTSLWRSRRKVHAQGASQNSSSKMASRMTAMVLTTNAAFVLLVMPISIAHLVSFFRQHNLFESNDPAIIVFREITLYCEQLNYSVNFFLYVFCNKKFRDVFRQNVNVLCVKVHHTGQNTAMVDTSDRIQ